MSTSALLTITSVLDELRTTNEALAAQNEKLRAIRKRADALEEQAIKLINQGGYKGRPMRLGGNRYTLVDKEHRDGFTQHLVRDGITAWLKARGQQVSIADDIMATINAQRASTKKLALKIEKA